MSDSSEGRVPTLVRFVGSYVNHDDVLVRFVSLWLVVATVFTVAWVGSYSLLPQGVLRDVGPVATAEYAGSVRAEFRGSSPGTSASR